MAFSYVNLYDFGTWDECFGRLPEIHIQGTSLFCLYCWNFLDQTYF